MTLRPLFPASFGRSTRDASRSGTRRPRWWTRLIRGSSRAGSGARGASRALLVPDVWADLGSFEDAQPDWALIIASPVYTEHIAPWLRRMLLETCRRMKPGMAPEMLQAMLVRKELLEGLLTEPYLAQERRRLVMENRRRAGEDEVDRQRGA